MKKKLNSGDYALIFMFISAIIYGYAELRKYIVRSGQDKYDFSYNVQRKALGIPVIPSHWYIKQRDPELIWWTGDEHVIGHKSKSVIFSGRDISEEIDVYNLPLQDGLSRLIEMTYKYDHKNHKDSISYFYQIDYKRITVSKKTVDSIFAAEKIKKD